MEKPPKDLVMVMCAFCGQRKTKAALQPTPIGGARCKDWFTCAQVREVVLHQQGQLR